MSLPSPEELVSSPSQAMVALTSCSCLYHLVQSLANPPKSISYSHIVKTLDWAKRDVLTNIFKAAVGCLLTLVHGSHKSFLDFHAAAQACSNPKWEREQMEAAVYGGPASTSTISVLLFRLLSLCVKLISDCVLLPISSNRLPFPRYYYYDTHKDDIVQVDIPADWADLLNDGRLLEGLFDCYEALACACLARFEDISECAKFRNIVSVSMSACLETLLNLASIKRCWYNHIKKYPGLRDSFCQVFMQRTAKIMRNMCGFFHVSLSETTRGVKEVTRVESDSYSQCLFTLFGSDGFSSQKAMILCDMGERNLYKFCLFLHRIKTAFSVRKLREIDPGSDWVKIIYKFTKSIIVCHSHSCDHLASSDDSSAISYIQYSELIRAFGYLSQVWARFVSAWATVPDCGELNKLAADVMQSFVSSQLNLVTVVYSSLDDGGAEEDVLGDGMLSPVLEGLQHVAKTLEESSVPFFRSALKDRVPRLSSLFEMCRDVAVKVPTALSRTCSESERSSISESTQMFGSFTGIGMISSQPKKPSADTYIVKGISFDHLKEITVLEAELSWLLKVISCFLSSRTHIDTKFQRVDAAVAGQLFMLMQRCTCPLVDLHKLVSDHPDIVRSIEDGMLTVPANLNHYIHPLPSHMSLDNALVDYMNKFVHKYAFSEHQNYSECFQELQMTVNIRHRADLIDFVITKCLSTISNYCRIAPSDEYLGMCEEMVVVDSVKLIAALSESREVSEIVGKIEKLRGFLRGDESAFAPCFKSFPSLLLVPRLKEACKDFYRALGKIAQSEENADVVDEFSHAMLSPAAAAAEVCETQQGDIQAILAFLPGYYIAVCGFFHAFNRIKTFSCVLDVAVRRKWIEATYIIACNAAAHTSTNESAALTCTSICECVKEPAVQRMRRIQFSPFDSSGFTLYRGMCSIVTVIASSVGAERGIQSKIDGKHFLYSENAEKIGFIPFRERQEKVFKGSDEEDEDDTSGPLRESSLYTSSSSASDSKSLESSATLLSSILGCAHVLLLSKISSPGVFALFGDTCVISLVLSVGCLIGTISPTNVSTHMELTIPIAKTLQALLGTHAAVFPCFGPHTRLTILSHAHEAIISVKKDQSVTATEVATALKDFFTHAARQVVRNGVAEMLRMGRKPDQLTLQSAHTTKVACNTAMCVHRGLQHDSRREEICAEDKVSLDYLLGSGVSDTSRLPPQAPPEVIPLPFEPIPIMFTSFFDHAAVPNIQAGDKIDKTFNNWYLTYPLVPMMVYMKQGVFPCISAVLSARLDTKTLQRVLPNASSIILKDLNQNDLTAAARDQLQENLQALTLMIME
eukprot:gnl/Carplike_NY0171/2321_a3128_298.p1 GENE.gnl/Carplike_NY0171/2321_a3128_298~~gnl/Carplike_NY0171/2321_a3128_298.p1  ORF type:complete len:1483 (+),score=298.15 gnl/Carplike_NY0171/2321_a3128_298:499-4449(+)